MPDDLDATPWVIGWIVAGGVVVLVAILLLTLIGLGRSIEAQARRIVASLTRAREHAAGLWGLMATNRALEDTIEAARAARTRLGSTTGRAESGGR